MARYGLDFSHILTHSVYLKTSRRCLSFNHGRVEPLIKTPLQWLRLLSDSVSSGDFSEKATQSWSKALTADRKNDNYHGNHNILCPLRAMLLVSTNSI